MLIKDYIQFHLNGIVRKKLYWIYILVVYFYLSFADEKNLFLYNYNDYVDRCADQQLFICTSLILLISLAISEKYFEIYCSLLCIYIQKPKWYFGSLAIAIMLSGMIPFAIGQMAFFLINAAVTGFIPWGLLFGNMGIVIMEIVALVFLGMGLFFLISKLAIVLIVFIFGTQISALASSLFFSIPLIASVTKVESGGYYTFPLSLWVGRSFLIIISFLFYCMVRNRFIKNQNK